MGFHHIINIKFPLDMPTDPTHIIMNITMRTNMVLRLKGTMTLGMVVMEDMKALGMVGMEVMKALGMVEMEDMKALVMVVMEGMIATVIMTEEFTNTGTTRIITFPTTNTTSNPSNFITIIKKKSTNKKRLITFTKKNQSVFTQCTIITSKSTQ